MEFSGILDRFIRYIKIDTQSDPDSDSFPSSKKQFDLAKVLKEELEALNLEEVELNQWGYVTATLSTNQSKSMPTIALIAHMDTSPDVSGKNVNPLIHQNYNGKDITLSSEPEVILKVSDYPYLKEKQGHTLITSDGSTLLGADNKAGIAEIMSTIDYLQQNPQFPRPNINILFTPDEEIGQGTLHLKSKDIKADYGYTVDGEKLGEIEDETFCADSVDITVRGVNLHPGYAKGKLCNSLKIASAIIARFPQKSMSPETTENREGYIHPYHISGSIEETVIKILIRDFEENGLIDKERFIKDIVDSMTKEYPEAKIEFKVNQSYRNMKIILDQHPLMVEKGAQAIEMSGIKPIRSIIRGGTDGAKLSFMGLPTPNLFTGGSNFHSRYEWITLQDMQKASEVIVNLMKLWTIPE